MTRFGTAALLLALAGMSLPSPAHADMTLVREEKITGGVISPEGEREVTTILIKGNKTRIEFRDYVRQGNRERLKGGDGVINDGDAGRTTFLNPSRQAYFFASYHKPDASMPQTVIGLPSTITPLLLIKTVLGHVCRGWQITKSNPRGYSTSFRATVYATLVFHP